VYRPATASPEITSVVGKTFFKNSRPRPRPWCQGLEAETETLVPRSRDRDRDLGAKVSSPRPKPWRQGLATETETLVPRSRDRDRDLCIKQSVKTQTSSKSEKWSTFLLSEQTVQTVQLPNSGACCTSHKPGQTELSVPVEHGEGA